VDLSTAIVLGLAALIGSNQVLVRVPQVRRIGWLFWGLCIVDLVVGCAVLIGGLPGYEAFPAINWVVGLLLVMHVALNLQLRAQWEQEARREAQDARDVERQRMRDERDALDAEGSDQEPSSTR
jgi:uncharacterized membrane protein